MTTAVAVLAACLGTAAAWAADGGPRVLLELPKDAQFPRNSEGDVVELKDGRLMVAWSRYSGTVKGECDDHWPADIAAVESADGGKTWGAPRVLVTRRSEDLNVMSVSLLRLRDGSLAMFFLRKHSKTDCRPAACVSRDEGRTWSAPQLCIPDSRAGYYVLNNARAVLLASGRIALPLSRHPAAVDPKTGKATDVQQVGRLVCVISDDAGRTWRMGAEAPSVRDGNGREVVFQEPGLVELKDGRLMMYCRTNRREQWAAYSSDGGESWTAPAPMPGVVSARYAPATVARLSNGDLVMAWNDHSSAASQRGDSHLRAPMTVAVSKDEARTWICRKNVYESAAKDAGGLWTCYYAVREIGGRLLVFHCHRDRLSTSRLTEIPLDWLYAAPAAVPMSGPVNAMDFGAKGDGVHDDTPAIQAELQGPQVRGVRHMQGRMGGVR